MMMSTPFLTYQVFYDLEAAKDLGRILKKHQVAFELEDCSPSFDLTFTNSELAKEYRIKIQQQDFKSVDSIMLDLYAPVVAALDDTYYLYDFTTKELLEVVKKRDEWGHIDFLLAQKILQVRGVPIHPVALDTLYADRLKELAKPEKHQDIWITAGYILAVLGGVLGLFIGLHLLTFKKTIPNGERILAYTESDRIHGKRIAIISACFIFLILVYRIFTQYIIF
jgi:hypothetical protein